jgi:hypothetical protein
MATAHDLFLALHADTAAALVALVGQVGAGEIGPRQFGDLAAALLEEAHTEAVVLGRQHAGDAAPLEEDDRAFARLVVDAESEYLAGFVRDLEAGRYEDEDGAFRLAGAQQRAASYAGRLAGTANEAWGLTLPPETTLLYWVLGETENNCSECPALESRSPYRPDAIPTWPGMNATPCMQNCRCAVHTASGQTGFRLPEGA